MFNPVGITRKTVTQVVEQATGKDLSPQARMAALELMAEQARSAKIERLSKRLDDTAFTLARERSLARGEPKARWERREIRLALADRIVDLAQQIRDLGGQVKIPMGLKIPIPPPPPAPSSTSTP